MVLLGTIPMFSSEHPINAEKKSEKCEKSLIVIVCIRWERQPPKRRLKKFTRIRPLTWSLRMLQPSQSIKMLKAFTN